MKRILLIMSQPPGCNGVQALVLNKLVKHLDAEGWELHFAGPSPQLISVHLENPGLASDRLHYTNKISFSRRFSVCKNRCRSRSPAYLVYAALQLAAMLLEKITKHDSWDYLRRGVIERVHAAEGLNGFDVIAGKTPDFSMIALAGGLAAELNKPFLALVDDPYGQRDEAVFHPAEPEKQRSLLQQAGAVFFMSPLTRFRYLEAELVSAEKSWAMTDCYPESPYLYAGGRSSTLRPGAQQQVADNCSSPLQLIHLGMLPEWRPMDAFFDALEDFQGHDRSPRLQFRLDIFGYLYPEARQRVHNSDVLRSNVRIWRPVSHDQSHWLAEDADLQLVVIGPRHLDNQPSKFFEYLGHCKPVLVIGPPGNPIEAIVQDLGIGLYADVRRPEAILEALQQMAHSRSAFLSAYAEQAQAIRSYSATSVAKLWTQALGSLSLPRGGEISR